MKKHSTLYWLELFEIELIDPDGWRGVDSRPMQARLLDLITLEEFWTRLTSSTILPRNSEKLKILESIV